MTVGDATDAESMVALLTGYLTAALHNAVQGGVLAALSDQEIDADGLITFRLASGMRVRIEIDVEPMAA